MDEYGEKSELPNSREKGIEDKQHCEEKQIAGIPIADKTLIDFAHLQLDKSSMPSTSGKIPRKTHRESDDLDASKKSWSEVHYSPYKIIRKRESGRASDISKLQDLTLPFPITDAEGRDPKGESSAVGSIMSEGGIEKSPERQIYEGEISKRDTELASYDSRRKNRKRKSHQKTEILDDPEELSTSEKGSDNEGSGQKQRKSEKDHASQKTGENVSELAKTKAPIKIIFASVPAKDGSLNYSVKKNNMDETSARKITKRRTEVPDETLGSKISSAIDKEFGILPISDPAKPSTSGENLVLSKELSDTERRLQVLANAKTDIRRLNIYEFLKLSEKEDQLFDQQHFIDTTVRLLSYMFKKHVKAFFTEHLTNTHNPRLLLSNAKKLENSLGNITKIIGEIPKLHLQANGGVNTLFDLIMNQRREPMQRAILGQTFDLNKIDGVQLMKKYDLYVKSWLSMVNYYDEKRDDVHKKIEALQTTLKEAIKTCEEGEKFISALETSFFLKKIAVLQRSHQIGEDIMLPPRESYNAPDSYLERVKEGYLNPIPCTDELHALHSQRSVSCSGIYLSLLNESRDGQPQNSLENSPEDIERVSREFLQKDSSDENEMDDFQGKELSGLGLNPNTSKYLPRQFLMSSSDVQQIPTDPSSQLTYTRGSIGVQETSTDATSQPQFQLIPSMGTSGIEKSSTDTEYQHFQPTPVIVYRDTQMSSMDTNSQLFQLLTGSNDMKKQTDTNCKQNQPLDCADLQQCSTDPNCQTITTVGEKIEISSNPDTLIQRSLELQEHEAYSLDSKDQNKSEAKISSDTSNWESLDPSSVSFTQFIELGEQKAVVNSPESNPINISGPDSPKNQTTSTPIKRTDGREQMDFMDSSEHLEDSPSEIDGSEDFYISSSSDSDFMVCEKGMELDEKNDQLRLLAHEIEEFGKELKNLLSKTCDAIDIMVILRQKMDQNLQQFLKLKISDLIKKSK